jgi:D-alanyl-D-alanine carboxypeptidase
MTSSTPRPARTPRTARRPRVLAAAATLVAAACLAGAALPAAAAAPAPAPAPAAPAAPAALPPLDPAALRAAIAGLPDADVTGALVEVTGAHGAERWTGVSGTGDLATGAPVRAGGSFRIGSVSKVFTTTVVLQLVAEHRIDLGRTVQHYLPGLLPAGYPPVTVGELLDHTSGLPSGGSTAIWGDGTTEWFAAHAGDSGTPEQVVRDAMTYPEEFAPGTAQQYNGLNTFLAGLVVEKVTGRTMATELRDRITGPLGLRDTYLPAADDDRLPHPAAHGYLTVSTPGGGTRPADVTEQSPWPWAEGGMISSAPDLDRFVAALFRGELLPPAQQKLLFTVPDVPNHDNGNCQGDRACFSSGLMSARLPDGTVVWGKTGSRPGYTSGVFATRDLSREVAYTMTPTGLQGAEAPYVLGIVGAVFAPGEGI